MKKRIRGMTSASRGEKERKRRPLRRARMLRNDASERKNISTAERSSEE